MANPSLKSSDPVVRAQVAQMVAEGLTDRQIAEKLEGLFGHRWHIGSIQRMRTKAGLLKQPASVSKEKDKTGEEGLVLARPPVGLDEVTKARWFRDRFRRSHLFTQLNSQFEAAEVLAYVEEYGQVCCQFEDIVTTEFMQIDDFLKHRILINRELARVKQTQRDIDMLNGWVFQNPPRETDAAELKKERIERYRLLEAKHTALKTSNERYDKLVAERQKIYANLAATRRDRLDELKGGSNNFFSLVASIQQSAEVREQHGRFAEMTRMASDESLAELRAVTKFPDGEEDTVVLDDTIVKEKEDEEDEEETEIHDDAVAG